MELSYESSLSAEQHEENLKPLDAMENYDEVYRTYKPKAKLEPSVSTTSTLKEKLKLEAQECQSPADNNMNLPKSVASSIYKETENDRNPISVALPSKPDDTNFRSGNQYIHPEHLKYQYSQYRVASGQNTEEEHPGYKYCEDPGKYQSEYEILDKYIPEPKQSMQNFKYAEQANEGQHVMTAAEYYGQMGYNLGLGMNMGMGMPQTNYCYGCYNQPPPTPGISYQFPTPDSDFYKFSQLPDQGSPQFTYYQSSPSQAQLRGGQCDGYQLHGPNAACAASFTSEATCSCPRSHHTQYYSESNLENTIDTCRCPMGPTCSTELSDNCNCCCCSNSGNYDGCTCSMSFPMDRTSLNRDGNFEMPDCKTVTQCQVGHSAVSSGNKANIAGSVCASALGMEFRTDSMTLNRGEQASCAGLKIPCAMPSMSCYEAAPPMSCQSPQPQYCACSGNCLDIESFMRRARGTHQQCLPNNLAASSPSLGCCPPGSSYYPGVEPRYCSSDILQSQTVYTADYRPFCEPGNNFKHFPKCGTCGSCGTCGGCSNCMVLSSCYQPAGAYGNYDSSGGCMPPIYHNNCPMPYDALPQGCYMMPQPGCYPSLAYSPPFPMPCSPCPTPCCGAFPPPCPTSCPISCMLPHEMPVAPYEAPADCCNYASKN